jgi:hypothetical protein
MPDPRDDDGVTPVIDAVTDYVSSSTERHDQLAVAWSRCRAAAFRQFCERMGSCKQCLDGALS